MWKLIFNPSGKMQSLRYLESGKLKIPDLEPDQNRGLSLCNPAPDNRGCCCRSSKTTRWRSCGVRSTWRPGSGRRWDWPSLQADSFAPPSSGRPHLAAFSDPPPPVQVRHSYSKLPGIFQIKNPVNIVKPSDKMKQNVCCTYWLEWRLEWWEREGG